MIRLALPTDAALIDSLLSEFIRQTGGVPEVFDANRYMRRIQNWPLVQAVDDVAGVFCELKVREGRKPNLDPSHPAYGPNAEFSGAFPRGASKGLIAPVFSLCAKTAIAHFPKRQQAAVRLWPVWGTFLHGQDENRIPDGGKGICESWRDFYLARGRTSITAEVSDRGSLWIARMQLGELADDGGI